MNITFISISGNVSELDGRKLVLFPAGKKTKILLKYGKVPKPAYIIDNSSLKIDCNILDIPVLPVRVLLEESDEQTTIVVTSQNLLGELYKQLNDYKIIHKFSIVICYIKNAANSFYDDFTFIDRRKDNKKVLIVLAGYKHKLWDIFFKRILAYINSDIDVCIMSAGKYDNELADLCEQNSWSYLSTCANNISLIQNIAIELHPEAEFIYKLDEDIFITEDYFNGLMRVFIETENSTPYHIGIVAPLIPVNPHGIVRFLEGIGKTAEFESLFGKVYYDFSTHFETNTDETLYLWEQTLPLDKTAKIFSEKAFSYYICPHRFSIGAILFRRKIWEEMGGFTVSNSVDLGSDEKDFAKFFLTEINFYTYIIAENILVGHYSFGKIKDFEKLDDYYKANKSLFNITTELEEAPK